MGILHNSRVRIVVGCRWSWCTACFASVTGGLRNFPFSPWVKLAIGCSVTSRILCAFVRSVVSQCAAESDVCNDHARVCGSFSSTMFFPVFFFLVTFTMAKCALLLVFPVLVCFICCMIHFFLGCVGVCVSRVFKDQVYCVDKLLFFD